MKGSFVERGGIWVAIQAAILLAILALGVTYRSSPLRKGMAVAGGLCLVSGGCFGVAGALALGSNLTPLPKPFTQAQLVRHGIYARVRHPLYTGVALLSAGWALVWQSWPATAAVLVLALFFDAKARREERWLREKFAAYEDYSKTTHKFIPEIY
jgi:protein-S-isoprenylcysteine O-methyltransferase Ste14